MDPIYVPLLSALAGTVIGSISSVAAILVQAKLNARADRLKQAVQLAIEEFREGRRQVEQSKSHFVMAPPLTMYVHFHTRVLEVMSYRKLSPSIIKELSEEYDELLASLDHSNKPSNWPT